MDYLNAEGPGRAVGSAGGGTQSSSLMSSVGGTAQSKDLSFKDLMKSFFNDVNNLQLDADEKMKGFASGQIQNVHEVFLAAEKAKLALQLVSQIRTQIINAYNTILQMQV